MISRDIFENLFVLEMTNNHQGCLERGKRIVKEFSRVVRFNNVRAAIKLQFRDNSTFVHKDFIDRQDIRYVRRVLDNSLTKQECAALVDMIKKNGCIPMATPFDEMSVDWCVEFDMPIIKIASADSNDWMLIERIAKTRKPVIVSVGGTSLKDIDDMVEFFEKRDIPLAINHCIAAYPHEVGECELNQIDFLMNRYPGHIIGYSSHESDNWSYSVAIAYAKGARTFERHIDINDDGFDISKYSSLPHQIDTWFKAFQTAKTYCGASGKTRKEPLTKETNYLDSYIRGVYAKKALKKGDLLSEDNIYLSIPLQKGQISTRELMLGQYGHKMLASCEKDAPLTIDIVDTPYAQDAVMKSTITNRGLSL